MRLPLEVKVWTHPLLRGPLARWRECEPFVENKVAVLIHRPMTIAVHKCGRRPSHLSVRNYCGNVHIGKHEKFEFHAVPPEDALLCAACEERAVMAGLPTATSLAGRHVHVGKLKAARTCCRDDRPSDYV